MEQRRFLTCLALLGCLSTGCGSGHSSAAAACVDVAACGGDITGNWKILNFCFDQPSAPSNLLDVCPTATLNVSNTVVTGNISYKADKTFTSKTNLTATLTLTIPGSCLQGQNAVTCDQLESSSNQTGPNGKVACISTADAGCQCSSSLQDSGQDSGTYTVDKARLTLVSDNGGTDEEDFCIEGSNLYLLAPMTMQLPANMSDALTGNLVLQRQ
jgi:hypothetical protein